MIFAFPASSIEIPYYKIISVDSTSTPTSNQNGIHIWDYDPSPICENQVAPQCTDKIFKVFTQGAKHNDMGDHIRSYTCTVDPYGEKPPVWSDPGTDETQLGTYPCGVVDPNFSSDTFAGPDGIRLPNGTILFYIHGAADSYNGFIEYRFTPDNGNPITKKLLAINPCNISCCTCCGGFARVAALKDDYYYIYFEVWLGADWKAGQNGYCVANRDTSLNITCPEKIANTCKKEVTCIDPKSNELINPIVLVQRKMDKMPF